LAPPNADGLALVTWSVDALRMLDEWVVLTDGSIAIVRGQDYHVDFFRPDGTVLNSKKLSFDWRARSDEEKQLVQDSTRAQLARVKNFMMISENTFRQVQKNVPVDPTRVKDAAPSTGGYNGYFPQLADPLPLNQIPDYYPPIRLGAVKADRDGNLWVLPTTSKQSQQGELVYDVINAKGELFQRVRAPLGRLIVGFGKNGTVYMATGNSTAGFVLEKTHLPE
jgi:hypothetical protein